MADDETSSEVLEIHTLTGDLHVAPSDDGRFSIFVFATPDGPVRVALRNEDLPRLIATAAHAYSPEMPRVGKPGPGLALPTIDWSVVAARGDAIAFGFELSPGASLTFVVPAAKQAGLVEAVQAAVGMTTEPNRSGSTRLN